MSTDEVNSSVLEKLVAPQSFFILFSILLACLLASFFLFFLFTFVVYLTALRVGYCDDCMYFLPTK